MYKVELIVAFIFACICGAGALFIQHQNKELKEQATTIYAQTSTIRVMKEDAEKMEKSTATTDKIVAKVGEYNRQFDLDTYTIDKKINSDEQVIRKKYNDLLVSQKAKERAVPNNSITVVTDVATDDFEIKMKLMEAAEISAVRIDGAWDVYCHGNPTDVECKVLPDSKSIPL